MAQVWKYPLNVSPYSAPQEISMPEQGKVIHFDFQNGVPTIWAICDSFDTRVTRRFQVYGTGFDIDEGDTHIATWQDGVYVWHLFEKARN